MVGKKFLYFLVISFVLILSSVIVYSIVQTRPQNISVQVTDHNGNVLNNVQVQGLIPVSPNVGSGLKTIFLGVTGGGGSYTTYKLGTLSEIAKGWLQYQGSTEAGLSSPSIIIILTYNTTSGLYFSETSIEFSTINFLKGKSFNGYGKIDLSKKPDFIPENGTNNSLVTNDANNFCSDNIPQSHSILSCRAWLPVNSTKADWPSYGIGNIPIAMMSTDAHTYGTIMTAFLGKTDYNTAIFTNMNSNIHYHIFGSMWQTTAVMGVNTGTISPSSTATIYIRGQIIGQEYRFCQWTNKMSPHCYSNTSMFLAGIVNVQTSNGYISSGWSFNSPNIPNFSNYLMENNSYSHYENYNGTGSSEGNSYNQVYYSNVVNSTKYSSIQVVDIGPFLASVLNTSSISLGTILPLEVMLSTPTSNPDIFSTEFDGMSGLTVNFKVLKSDIQYEINGDPSINGYLEPFYIKLEST